MQSEELFRAGFSAAVELMKEFDGPAMVTDELVEFLEEKPGESYELFQQTPEWHRIQEREAVKASDRVRAARRTGFLAGHRAAEAVVDVYFSPSAIALAITTRLRDRESGDLANFMAAQENV